jgi:hypothetical protein
VSIQPQTAERIVRLLIWVSGVAATVCGAWVTSKIRIFHDDKKSHHQELKEKVLVPLREFLIQHLALFAHQKPVIVEVWGNWGAREARADQDAFEYGGSLQSENPWPGLFSAMDRALLEDARLVHYKKLMVEISGLASAWQAHVEKCSAWMFQMGWEILSASKMNPYEPPYTVPYVNHLRLAAWVYRRLFKLPTDALHQSNQGQYWSIEGAPTVPAQIGVSTMAPEEQNGLLLQAIDKITAENRARAIELQRESMAITNQAVYLRSKLEYEIAKKKLKGRCDLVRFSVW